MVFCAFPQFSGLAGWPSGPVAGLLYDWFQCHPHGDQRTWNGLVINGGKDRRFGPHFLGGTRLVPTLFDPVRTEPKHNPFFSVLSELSVADPQDTEQESNHRGLKELREELDFNGVRVGRLGWGKAIYGKT